MNYSEYLVRQKKKQALEAYAALPPKVRKYTLPELTDKMNEVIHSNQETQSDLGFAYFHFIRPINELVLSGHLDFNKESELEEIVRKLK